MGTATSVSTSNVCQQWIDNFSIYQSNLIVFYRVPVENELVTKTVDLMKQTNRVKAMIDLCREEMVGSEKLFDFMS